MLSNNPGTLILAVVFAIGAIFFAAGSLIVRRERRAGEVVAQMEPVLTLPPWSAELAGTSEAIESELRLDMIERLAMLGEPWCVGVLDRARAQDPDPVVREAADAALMVIGSRATARTPRSYGSTSP